MTEWMAMILAVAGLYVAIGVAFAIAFVFIGVDRIDPNAKGAGFGFRILILPGSAAFWPLLLRRWIGGSPPPIESNAHRDASQEESR